MIMTTVISEINPRYYDTDDASEFSGNEQPPDLERCVALSETGRCSETMTAFST